MEVRTTYRDKKEVVGVFVRFRAPLLESELFLPKTIF
jgi:hypothetical protein